MQSVGRRLHGRRGLKYRGCRYSMRQGQSPPSRAAWIEILEFAPLIVHFTSPPSRAAWIEIVMYYCNLPYGERRRLHGRRGLKFAILQSRSICASRRLHGRRGLKLLIQSAIEKTQSSPPSRAAWIEIPTWDEGIPVRVRRRLHGRRGLKSTVIKC